jgi:hypothetical protein
MDGIFVEQMLFGYSSGHALINTSLKKKLIRQRDVDLLSDASGIGKFNNYITCYPICEDGYYVFAKTWYADEMQRPGCVWTHVILVTFEDMVKSSGKINISEMFHRPNLKEGFKRYGEPILCSSKKNVKFEYTEYVIYTLFHSNRKVLIEDENSEKYERPLIDVLSVLPTYLLQKITVCTCSLTNRYFNNEIFDYQVTLRGKANIFLREITNGVIYKNIDAEFDFPLWVKYLKEQFVNENQSGLFHLCEKYEKKEREDLCNFSKVYYSVKEFRENITLQDYYILLKKIDNENELIEKTELLIYVENDREMWEWLEYESLIIGLLEEMKKKNGIFSRKNISDKTAKKYAEEIYKKSSKDNIQKIFVEFINRNCNFNANKIVKNMVAIMKADDLYNLLELKYNVCIVLVMMDCRFLRCKQIWKQDRNFQLEMLTNADVGNYKGRLEILKCIIENSNQNISQEVYQIFGDELVDALVMFYKSRDTFSKEQIQFWIPYCAREKKVYIDLIKTVPNLDIIYELLCYVDSYCIFDIEECKLWISVILRWKNNISAEMIYRVAYFVLPFIIKLHGSGDSTLDRMVFEQINEKLESSTIDFYDWKNVSRILPEVSLEQSWDKCLRLRLAFQDILGLKVY